MTGPRVRSGAGRPGPPGRRVDSARRAAYDLLHAVGADDAYANLALPGVLRDHRLTGRDAAFTTDLAYGTLRWRGLLDAVLATCVDRPLERIDPPLLDVLRLGAHQVLFMRVPAHAAVGETVSLARDVCGDGPARLANAVLRRVAAHDRDGWVARVAPPVGDDPAGHLAVAWSHPRWIVVALHEALGGDWARTTALLQADDEPARPTLVARPGRFTPEQLRALPGVEPGRWSPLAGVLATGRPQDLPPVRDGSVGVQDEGSQLVALLVARAPVEGTDDRWADLAAGPGGKAALLAGWAAERGGSLVAMDLHPHRARLVERALSGTPGVHEVRVGDATLGTGDTAWADRVLVDAPCTGLGVLRRRPESRWRRSPSDVAALAPVQRGLLRAALDTVRPGGVVVYATCSPHLAETDLVVEDVLRERRDVTVEDARPLLPEVAGTDVGPGPALRLWPHVHGTDGMYATLLRRT